MFDPDVLPILRKVVNDRAQADKKLLDTLRREVRSFAGDIHIIQPRSATAVSLVASDGGNNKLAFDPFYVQLVRVTDSYGKELCLDAVSPTTDTDELSRAQFEPDGTPKTALGKMMRDLGVQTLNGLSPMIPKGSVMRETPEKVKPGWVLVYRDLCEWAVLYERIVFDSFATDTLIVRDGQLRAKIFAKDLFIKWRENVEAAIEKLYRRDRRRVFLVGIAKHSKVIDRYRLAMAIESIFPGGEPRYVRIPGISKPRPISGMSMPGDQRGRGRRGSAEVCRWRHVLRPLRETPGDPIWAVDILSSQSVRAQEIFGYLLNDATNGFQSLSIPFVYKGSRTCTDR